MRAVFYLLFGCAFTAGTSYALGRIILRKLPITGLSRIERRIIGFLCGSAALSLLVFALCAAHLALKGVFLALGVAAIAVSSFVKLPKTESIPASAASRALLIAPLAVFGFVYLMNAMAPEVSPDGSAYHLGFVARYYHWHGFRPITTNLYANMPQAMEMLFLFAYAFGRHSAAALTHLTFLFALALLIWGFAARRGFDLAGAAAAGFVFLSPVFGVDGSSAYNDVALAATGFGCFVLLEKWRESHDRFAIPLAGILAGFAFGLKYTGSVVLLYALASCLISRPYRAGWKRAVVLLAPAILSIAPWLIRAALVTHDPFSPFLNAWFPNRAIHVSFEQEYSRNFRHIPLANPWTLPWALSWNGALGGSLGPVFLLVPLGLLALRRPLGRRIWFTAFAFAALYPLNTGARFLMLSAPLLALASALAMATLLPGRASRISAYATLLASAGVFAWPEVIERLKAPTCWSLEEVPVRAALRLTPEETFIRRRLPHYDMARFIEKVVPESGRVLALDPVAEAYTTRTVLVSYESAESELERDILLTAIEPSLKPDRITRFRFPAQRVRSWRVVQTAGPAPDTWSVNEISAWSGSAAIPNDPLWTATASAWPWDTALALDGNLATRWSEWRDLRPGSFFEVHIPHPQSIDRVDIQSAHDYQSRVRLALELTDDAGAHTRLGQPEVLALADVGDLRKQAVRALKQRGAGYLMAPNGNVWAAEFLAHSKEWGMTLLGAWGNARLYRLDG